MRTPPQPELKSFRYLCRAFRMVLILLLLVATGCQSKENSKVIPPEADSSVEAPEDFQEFYIAFHTDSTYQMAHILFPLDGAPAADHQDGSDFKWEKENWKLHSLDHFDPEKFSVHRDIADSTLITEYIKDEKTGFGIKRRFAKFDDEWFLIYYSAMNPGSGS